MELGFASHVGQTFEFICNNNKLKESTTVERAEQRGKAQIDASRRQKRTNSWWWRWSLLAIKMKARTVVGRGKKSLLNGPGSELLLLSVYNREDEAEDNIVIEEMSTTRQNKTKQT